MAKPMKRKGPSPIPIETPQDVRPPKPPKISDRSPSVQKGQPGRPASEPPMLGPPPLPPPSAPPSREPSQAPGGDRSRSPAVARAQQLLAIVNQQARKKHDKFKNELSSAVQRVSARQAAQDAADSLIIAKTSTRQRSLDAMLSRLEAASAVRSDSPWAVRSDSPRGKKNVIKIPENMSTLRPKLSTLPSQALAIRSAPYVRG